MSNIGTITEMVEDRLSFIESLDSELVKRYRMQAFYDLQNQTGKSLEEVENEDLYSPLQKMLLADMTAYELLKKQVLKFSAGTDGEKAGAGTRRLKRSKADVVEAEFSYNDSFVMKASEVMNTCRQSVCSRAYNLGYSIAYCHVDDDDYSPFRTVTDC